MRIGFDAHWASGIGTGTASYTFGLCRALIEHRDHQFVLYYEPGDERSNPLFALGGPNVERRIVAGRGQVGRTWIGLVRAAARDRLDVFHSPAYFLPPVPCRRVVTFHDVNMFLQWRRWWRPGMRLGWTSLAAQTLAASRLADCVVADSRVAADAIHRTLHLGNDIIRVVYPGIDDEFLTDVVAEQSEAEIPALIPEKYFVYVGVLSPQKNLEGVIRAFGMLQHRDVSLVIVGREDGLYFDQHIRPLIHRLGLDERVVIAGVIDQWELRVLLRKAMALVFVSFAEGFGLPPLEAMALGTPVIASRVSSMPEVLGDAALFVDPYDPADIGGAMQRMMADATLCAQLAQRGRSRAAEFRWSRAASQMISAYESVA